MPCFLLPLRNNKTNEMKKLFLALAVVVLCGMAVSCGKEDIRDQLNPMEVQDQEGTLEINDWDLYLERGFATLIAAYRDAKGVYEPEKVRVNPGEFLPKIDGDYAIFEFTVPGSYTVCAGNLSIDIKVMK